MEVGIQNSSVKSEPQTIVPDLEEPNEIQPSHILPHKINLSPSKPRNPSSNLSTHKISTIHSSNTTTSTTPSVIQSPSSVIQTTGGVQLSKNVILVSSSSPSKQPNSGVIHQTTGGAIQTVQVLEAHHSDESLSNDGIDPPDARTADRRRREILTRRPSYRKILSELGGGEISADKDSASTSESSQDGSIVLPSGHYSAVKVINANALGLGTTTAADGSTAAALQTLTMTNTGTTGGTIVQYAQSDGQQFFVPVGSGELQAYTIRPVSSASTSPSVVMSGGMGHSGTGEPEVTKKREIRLLKNREAARECRRKKKEYIKCLENRVAVLENQNKALIDELKSLKELYCQQKTD